MKWVVDCSFTSALFIPNEYSVSVERFFNHLPPEGVLYVPSVWWAEVTNVLYEAVKREVLQRTDVLMILGLFREMGIITDTMTGYEYGATLHELASDYRISAYDASYIELSLRRSAALGSVDPQIVRAAELAGIQTAGF